MEGGFALARASSRSRVNTSKNNRSGFFGNSVVMTFPRKVLVFVVGHICTTNVPRGRWKGLFRTGQTRPWLLTDAARHRSRSNEMTKTNARDAELRDALMSRRQQLLEDVQGRIREEREQRDPTGARDMVDVSDAILQKDIDLALLQMRAATLTRIEEALNRLDGGQYGRCFECAGSIAVARLRALPFAVRCVECERDLEGSISTARERRSTSSSAL